MNAPFGAALDRMSRLESLALERYRALAPLVAGPAERRLADSVMDRKVAHVTRLDSIAAAAGSVELELPGLWPFEAASASPSDDAATTLLSLILNEESAMSRSYTALADAAATLSPEASFGLRALADSSGKFASWAREHLQLLGLG